MNINEYVNKLEKLSKVKDKKTILLAFNTAYYEILDYSRPPYNKSDCLRNLKIKDTQDDIQIDKSFHKGLINGSLVYINAFNCDSKIENLENICKDWDITKNKAKEYYDKVKNDE